jgi:nicotinamide-nucleotide amidase
MLSVEILAIGNELLLGDVLDTNSNWLCQQFTGRGARVRRVALVPDEGPAIGREVRGALEREADLLVITGGLGPTDDDRTLLAVAEALGRPLEENPQAIAFLEQRYSDLIAQGFLRHGGLTPPRRKMAQLPAGGEAVPNPIGTAPAVVLREGKTVLVCLPGVPEEMRGIFEGPLAGTLAEVLGAGTYAEWAVVVHAGEAMLAPLLRQVAEAHADVYVKSHARRLASAGTRLRVKVTLSLAGPDPESVRAGLQAALDDLQAALAEGGIALEEIDRAP